METTPMDIRHKQFKVKFRGFDIQEVDTFLEKMAEAFESLLLVNETLHKKIQKITLEMQGFKEREDSFKRVMLNSQNVLDQMKENSRKSSEIIIAEAEVKAEKILNKAHNRLAQLHEDITELKRQRLQIEIRLRSILETHTKLLDIGKEEEKNLDETDSKIKLLKQAE